MTGTGTQADPYIVENWADFVTAAGTSGAYVRFADSTVIDLDVDHSEGFSSDITIRCTEIDGNGGEIRGLFLINNARLVFQGNITVNSLTISAIRRDGGSEPAFLILESGTFSGCIITGSFGGEAMIYNGGYTTFNCCSMNVQLQANTAFIENYRYDNRCLRLFNSKIKVTGTPYINNNKNRQIVLENTLLLGELPTDIYYSSYGSVVDCNVPDNTALSCDKGAVFINSDKFGSGVTAGSRFIRLTDEQVHSADYLYSVGFPVAGV